MTTYLTAPIEAGFEVRWGPKGLFWRTVEKIGDAVFVDGAYYVPVQYRNGTHDLLKCLENGGQVSFVTVEPVRSQRSWVNSGIKESVVMPQILRAETGNFVVSVLSSAASAEKLEAEVQEEEEGVPFQITLGCAVGGTVPDEMRQGYA